MNVQLAGLNEKAGNRKETLTVRVTIAGLATRVQSVTKGPKKSTTLKGRSASNDDQQRTRGENSTLFNTKWKAKTQMQDVKYLLDPGPESPTRSEAVKERTKGERTKRRGRDQNTSRR